MGVFLLGLVLFCAVTPANRRPLSLRCQTPLLGPQLPKHPFSPHSNFMGSTSSSLWTPLLCRGKESRRQRSPRKNSQSKIWVQLGNVLERRKGKTERQFLCCAFLSHFVYGISHVPCKQDTQSEVKFLWNLCFHIWLLGTLYGKSHQTEEVWIFILSDRMIRWESQNKNILDDWQKHSKINPWNKKRKTDIYNQWHSSDLVM